jgi:pyruvate/2-oxoacid:ferredoxin oxidoreductase alpha subunit
MINCHSTQPFGEKMNQDTIETFKLIASFFTPIIVLVLGALLSKEIETIKSSASKVKGWQEYWASQFIEIAKEYNDTATKVLIGFHSIAQISYEKLPGWENELENQKQELSKNSRNLTLLEWKIQNFLQFAPKHGNNVQERQKELFNLIGTLLRVKDGDWEKIRNAQFRFNDAVRYAHNEILEIVPNKAIQKRH